jgi:hypothetical protein
MGRRKLHAPNKELQNLFSSLKHYYGDQIKENEMDQHEEEKKYTHNESEHLTERDNLKDPDTDNSITVKLDLYGSQQCPAGELSDDNWRICP